MLKADVLSEALSLLTHDVHVHYTARSWTIKLQEKDILPSAAHKSTVLDWEGPRCADQSGSNMAGCVVVDSVMEVPGAWRKDLCNLSQDVLHQSALVFVADYGGGRVGSMH